MPVDQSPLLPSDGSDGRRAELSACHPTLSRELRGVSLSASVANLVLAVLGAGQLVLPYAMSELGLWLGVSSLVGLCVLSVHSCYVISIHELFFKPSPHDCLESYSELVVRVLGKAGASLCSLLLAIYAWGGALSFMLILKTELSFLTGWPGEACLPLLAAVFIWPLSSCANLSALKTVSPLGCFAALLITLVVLLTSRWNWHPPLGVATCEGAGEGEGMNMWPSSFLGVAACLPLLSFALNSTWAFVPILSTLDERTAPQFSRLIGRSNLIILINYILISVYGYAMFCGQTQPNILESLGSIARDGTVTSKLIWCARVALSVQLSLALPMRFFVARRSVCPQVHGPVGRAMLALCLVGSSSVLAILPLPLASVLGIVSSICASMIIYILPAIVDLHFRLPDPFLPVWLRLATSILSLLVGCFILFAGLAANFLGISVGGR
ncbi:MAG: hypothetical protein SGPRY_003449 [Prymnesium sp.]